jgi:hypothetical protein
MKDLLLRAADIIEGEACGFLKITSRENGAWPYKADKARYEEFKQIAAALRARHAEEATDGKKE